MQNAELRKQILGIIHEIMDNNYIQIDTAINEVAFDSLRFIKFVVQVEKTFKIRFENDFLLLHNYKTISDICDYIENKVAE